MKKEELVSAAPYLRSKDTTATIMRDVVFALLPAAGYEIYRFGFRVFLLLLLSVTSCVLAEHVWKSFRKIQNGGYECSAVVTGLLLGMLLPVEAPYWLPVAGGVFAILVVKMAFGGLGRNLLNPAAATGCLGFMIAGFFMKDISLESLEPGPFPLLLGGLYLILRKVISIRVPAAYLLSYAVVTILAGGNGLDLEWLMMQICNGSLMLGAFFMANDDTTSPMTNVGKLIFGVLLGVLTGVFQLVMCTPAAVVCAVVAGNLPVPLIEKMTFPKSFGKGKKANI